VSGRLIAIGDIHGCREALRTVLDEVAPGTDDVVITLGDHVDRGPDSKGVIDDLVQLGRSTRLLSLLGNHEEMMLDVLTGRQPHFEWVKHGGQATLESYGFDGDLDILPESHIEFFGNLGDYFESEDYFFTHAAYDPNRPLDDQPDELLRWHSLRDGVPPPHASGKVAVVGHTANPEGEIVNMGHILCIDTHCYRDGYLTAVDLTGGHYYQASKDGRSRFG